MTRRRRGAHERELLVQLLGAGAPLEDTPHDHLFLRTRHAHHSGELWIYRDESYADAWIVPAHTPPAEDAPHRGGRCVARASHGRAWSEPAPPR